jgi:hypothetical protein
VTESSDRAPQPAIVGHTTTAVSLRFTNPRPRFRGRAFGWAGRSDQCVVRLNDMHVVETPA